VHWKAENIPFFQWFALCIHSWGRNCKGIAKNAVSASFLFCICRVCVCVYMYIYIYTHTHAHISHFLLVLPGTSHFQLCRVLVTLQITKSFSAGIYLNCEYLLQVNYLELKAEIWFLTSAGSRSLSHVIEIQNGQVELQFLCVDLTWNGSQIITFPM